MNDCKIYDGHTFCNDHKGESSSPMREQPNKLYLYSSGGRAVQRSRTASTVEPRLSGFLDYPDFLILWSQFCHEYLLVMIKIRSHILFKTTALKSEVKASLFRFQKAKYSIARTRRN